MGLGDEIMATAQAREVKRVTNEKTSFGEYVKLWKGNPNISGSSGIPVRNMTGDRPYILNQTRERCVFNPNFSAKPGDLYLKDKEYEAGEQGKEAVILQPNVKIMFSKGNKDWGWDNWQKLADLCDFPVYQMIQNPSERRLNGVKPLETKTFRIACATLFHARLFVGTDGGLHHAAAANYYANTKQGLVYKGRGPNAIVIWGGFSHPKHLGYPFHTNIRWDDSEPCGSKIACQHCKKMMSRITPEKVYETIKASL